jgi:hypothetical protein
MARKISGGHVTGASDGAKALELVLAQAEWTHRRVESLAFEANGETRRRVSWDFTVPAELTIQSSGDRVAIPLATLRKVPLKRLDVRDAAGQAIPVWGTQENSQLAVAALQAAVGSGGPDPLSSEMAEAI